MASLPPKKISLAFGKKAIPKASNGIKRRAAALHDSDDEDTAPVHHEISAFGSEGAVHASKPQGKAGPLVIPALPNHDLLEYGRKKRQRSDLPQEPGDIVIVKKDVTFGLLVPEKRIEEENGESDEQAQQDKGPEPKTEDQIALDALLGNGTSGSRTIPLADEDEAFKRDMSDAVEVPTLDQYLAIPPSEFGAACLRGMGWKDTETLGLAGAAPENTLKVRPMERRPALLGVGAKPSTALGIEIGEWGKSARGGKRGKEEAYNPVVLKNKKTGEVLSEQELKAKVAEQQGKSSTELVFDDYKDARKSERESDSRRKDDDKYRDKDRDRRRDRYDSSSKWDRDYKSYKPDSRDRQRPKEVESRERRDQRDRDTRRDRDDRKDEERTRNWSKYPNDRKERSLGNDHDYDYHDGNGDGNDNDDKKKQSERKDRYRDDRERSQSDKKDKYRDDKKERYKNEKYLSSSRRDRDRSDRDRDRNIDSSERRR